MSKALQFEKQHNNQVIKIKYEELIRTPEKTLHQIYSFLNLEKTSFQQAHLAEKRAVEVDIKASTSQRLTKKYGDLIKPINTNRLESWKTKLSSNQITLSDYICYHYGLQLAYNPQVKLFWLLKWKLFFNTFFERCKVTMELVKDQVTFYFPIKFKVKRFRKYVERIEKERNDN